MKERPNRLVGQWSLGRRMCGDFELEGDHITVYKTRFGERALFGVGRFQDGALHLKLSALDDLEAEAAFAVGQQVPKAQAAILYTTDEKSGGCVAAGSKELKGEAVVADMSGGKRVVALKEGAFEGCNFITKITLPTGLTSIGARAFFGCKSLKSVAVPRGLRLIPEYAFFGCNALEELTLPEGVTEIGSHAFEFCRSLRRIYLPASVKRIRGGAFWGCDRLDEVAISDLAAWCAVKFEGADAGPLFCGAELFVGGERTRFAEIPAGVFEIGSYAFAGSKLERVSIPQSVKRIAPSAFENCRALTHIQFGGTAGEWLALEKKSFADGTADFTVICADGKIKKGGTLQKKPNTKKPPF